ncbi:hypothetical protein JKA74_06600 [Marivirga sp. S37H4]|uniref:Uncharacterized protein n=1 Tax=Marivirga aurantiaca TaxID=2802615 RepID=A0A935C731_9BACT|nr:hypothetical protein [Marivirga aurantiaca]MBK6264700.1 hypothetical protein [Marivirga aurantiaca]
MKFLFRTILIAVVAHFSLLYFPWWSIAVCGFFAGALLSGTNASSFLSGFLGIGFLWFIKPLLIHNNSEGLLSDKIASLFSFPNGIYMVLITAIIGALVGGFSTLSGLRFRRLFKREKSRGLYK